MRLGLNYSLLFATRETERNVLGTMTHLKDFMSAQKPRDCVDQGVWTGWPLRQGAPGEDGVESCPSGLGRPGQVNRAMTSAVDRTHVCGLNGPARWWEGSSLRETDEFAKTGVTRPHRLTLSGR